MATRKQFGKRSARRSNVFVRQMKEKKKTKEVLGTWELTQRMIEQHQDLLQNIEFALVTAYRENTAIDDATMAKALKNLILSQPPGGEPEQKLTEALTEVREMRSDITDNIWRDGLRTVLQSIDRHSNLKPGKRDYIEFISRYVI